MHIWRINDASWSILFKSLYFSFYFPKMLLICQNHAMAWHLELYQMISVHDVCMTHHDTFTLATFFILLMLLISIMYVWRYLYHCLSDSLYGIRKLNWNWGSDHWKTILHYHIIIFAENMWNWIIIIALNRKLNITFYNSLWLEYSNHIISFCNNYKQHAWYHVFVLIIHQAPNWMPMHLILMLSYGTGICCPIEFWVVF